jgi:hypothetical protein
MPGLTSLLSAAGNIAGGPIVGQVLGAVGSLFGSGPPPVFRVDYGIDWLQPDMRKVHEGLMRQWNLSFLQVRNIIGFEYERLGKRIRGEWEQLVWSFWGINGENMTTTFKAAMDRYNATLYNPPVVPASVFAAAPAAAVVSAIPATVFTAPVAPVVSAFAATPSAGSPILPPVRPAVDANKGLFGALGDAIVKGGISGAAGVLGDTEYGQTVKNEGAVQFLKDNWYIPVGVFSLIAGLSVKAFSKK